MVHFKRLEPLALFLVLIGALNWGMVGFFDENVVARIFSDATLRDLARFRPTTSASFAAVKGIGERKVADLGCRFINEIDAYCREKGLPANLGSSSRTASEAESPSAVKRKAFDLFDQGKSIDEAATGTGRARSTVVGYLEDYLAERRPPSIQAWVEPAVYARVEAAAKKVGGSLLRPVFEELGGEVGYDEIRLVMRHAGLR